MTVSLLFLSRFAACCLSLVKLCSDIEADCIVEAIQLLMLSLVYDETEWLQH